jgi:hypothetical protein
MIDSADTLGGTSTGIGGPMLWNSLYHLRKGAAGLVECSSGRAPSLARTRHNALSSVFNPQ